MSLGERLYELRKDKKLSQEEVADKLNVTRQTVSKWETDESKPDFDKIVPICELFEIGSEELLTGKKEEITETGVATKENKELKKKRATFISVSILLYFIAVIWIIMAEETFHLDDGLMVGVFLLICGISTVLLVYQGITLYNVTARSEKKKEVKDKKLENIISLTATIFCFVYLLASFITMAWHLTWLIWILFAVVKQIIVTIYEMKKGE